MGHGLSTVFTAAIVSGTSSSSDINLGRGFNRVAIDAFAASGSVMFQVAPNTGGSPGTYRLLKYNVASGMSAPQTVTVGSATCGSVVDVPNLSGHQFVKVITDTTMTNGLTSIKLICSD